MKMQGILLAFASILLLGWDATAQSAMSPVLIGQAEQQAPITAEQAIQSVRQFWGDFTIPAVVREFYDIGDTGSYGSHYELDVDNHPMAGMYRVRASDGKVVVFMLNHRRGENPVIRLEEAQGIAEKFLNQFYPPFAQNQWALIPEYYIQNSSDYTFAWRRIVSKWGALAPYEVVVTVDGIAKRVVELSIPTDRITGPTEPHITLKQAKQNAATFAVFDPDILPFDQAKLQLMEDGQGLQVLHWILTQRPDPTEHPRLSYSVHVDAITGEVCGYEAPLGGPLDKPKPRSLPPLPHHIKLKTAQGRQIGSLVAPVMRDGKLWIRAELLRGLGLTVKIDRKSVQIPSGKGMLTNKTLGAQWREEGWWLPLQNTATKLGWQVQWLPETQEIVVETIPRAKQSSASPPQSSASTPKP